MPPTTPMRSAAGVLAGILAAGLLASCDADGVAPDPGGAAAAAGSGRMERGPPLSVETSVLPPALVGRGYDVALEADGGPRADRQWSLATGSLPEGLALGGDGRIRGVPVSRGTQSFTVAVTSGGRRARATLDLRVVADDADAYDVTLVVTGPVSTSVRSRLDAARDRWEEVVTGDLQSVAIPSDFFGPAFCDGRGPAVNGTAVDDLVLLVAVEPIDGRGGVVGRAGPCALRDDGLPFAGSVTLDADDVDRLSRTGELTEVVVHEIAHGLGFGALWPRRDFVDGRGSEDPRYSGRRGVAQYRKLGGQGDVPVEDEGGRGTAESHWRESKLGAEIMTSLSEPATVPEPLSAVTVGSLADLGYEVDVSAADRYASPARPGAASRAPSPGRPTRDVVIPGPLRILLENGRSTTIRASDRP